MNRESDPPIVVRDGNAGRTTAPRDSAVSSWQRSGQDGSASKALTTGHASPRLKVSSSLLAMGTRYVHFVEGFWFVRVILRSPVR